MQTEFLLSALGDPAHMNKEIAMLLRKTLMPFVVCAGFALGAATHALMTPTATVHAAGNRVFEIRTYTTPPGKLEALKSRFRDHTIQIFNRHGMTSIAYWVPQDAPTRENTLVYVLAPRSREAAAKNWAEFRADPEWVKAK